MRKYFVTYLLLLISMLIAGVANATPEDICPGGASPRSDISWCAGYDQLGSCTTGIEAGCASANGVALASTNVNQIKIKTCPVPSPITTSTGCAYGSGSAGGTGPGYANITPLQTGSDSACLRYYVRFGAGYMQNVSDSGNHAPALQWTDGASCTGDVSFDYTMAEGRLTVEPSGSTCGGTNPTTTNFNYTGTNWVPQNNKWYRIDLCATLNTTASSPSVGNGTVTMKVDGTTFISTSTVNMRGVSTTAKFKGAYVARGYMGFGVAEWMPNIYWAAAAYSNNGTEIGASPNVAGDLGTPDPLSPYGYNVAGDGAEQMKRSKDCTAVGGGSGYITTAWDADWGVGKSYVTSPDHNDYVCNTSECPACTTTNAMKAETTTTGQGAGLYRAPSNLNTTYFDQYVNHGWIYLPSSNSYSTTVPLSGFARYCNGAGGGNNRCWIGIARISGNIGISLGIDNVAGTSHTTSTAATLDTWHEYQIAVGTDNKCYLQWDGNWIIDGVTCNQAVSTWLFDDTSTGPQSIVHGIIRDSPATTFTVYYDDMDAGAASFNDGKFWHATSNPFGDPPAPPSPQKPPAAHMGSQGKGKGIPTN